MKTITAVRSLHFGHAEIDLEGGQLVKITREYMDKHGRPQVGQQWDEGVLHAHDHMPSPAHVTPVAQPAPKKSFFRRK